MKMKKQKNKKTIKKNFKKMINSPLAQEYGRKQKNLIKETLRKAVKLVGNTINKALKK